MTLASVPSNFNMGSAIITPKTAITLPPIRVMNRVEPITQRTFSRFWAPQACPTNTVVPAEIPITKASRKNRIGKNTETAAMASTPIICPTKMVLIVPDRFCKILVAIKGTRKTKKVFQRFGCITRGWCGVIQFASS